MKLSSLTTILNIISIILFLLLAVFEITQRKEIVTCRSFTTYSSALWAYQHGHPGLDRGGIKGIPCEYLLKRP